MRLAFFGTPQLTVPVLDALAAADLTPDLIVAAPDAPVGRHQHITAPPSVAWAQTHNIPTWQPATTRELSSDDTPLMTQNWDIFVVFAYGHIIPHSILSLPTHDSINLHPSLLPHLRGPSPIRSALLTDTNPTGVSIIRLDEQMDHGPILAQATHNTPTESWPPPGPDLDAALVALGAKLLTDTIPKWVNGNIIPQPQDHSVATYCSKIKKSDAEVMIDPRALPSGTDAYNTLLRIQAYAGWPEAYFIYHGQRVKIKSASLESSGALAIHRVVPAGRREMDFADYRSSLA